MHRPIARARLVALTLVVLSVPWVALAQQARRPIGLDDLARLAEVRDPQRSPDGRWVAYTVGTVDVEKDKRTTDVWMVGWDGREQVRLTTSPDSESQPRWSPDGRYLAFLAARGDEETKKKGAQVWLLNRSGGEAERITDVRGGVSDLAWSPDGTRLALVVKDADPADEPEKLDGWKRKTKPPIVIDRYDFKRDRDGYLKRLRSHVALLTLEGRKLDMLTVGDYDDESPTWSPDGGRIAFQSRRGERAERSHDSNIFVVEARVGATPQQLTTYPGRDGGRPAWSPDGKWIAYLQGDETRFSAYNQDRLAVVPSTGGDARLLTASLDRRVSSPTWTTDGRALTFLVEDDRTSWVGRVPAAGGAVERLTSGPRVVSAFSQGADGALAVLAATAREPFEVHALEGRELRTLTRHNDDLMASLALGTTEDVSFESKDGTEVHGLVVKPASYRAGERYPMLLYIHGGPNGQDQHAFSFDRELFAASGYVVLAVNYRGSSGRGSEFQKAIYADWGDKEVVDLLAGVDYGVQSGLADPARLGIGGWSYGGILTNYTIASDARFKAAVSGASSSLQLTMYGTDQYIVQYENEIGPPWKNPDGWMKVSYPFFHADRITTPTLFLVGEKDFNVPLAGVEQMYQALKSLGVDTELVIYPDQFHGITTPSYARDRLERYLAWFGKYLGTAPPTSTSMAGR